MKWINLIISLIVLFLIFWNGLEVKIGGGKGFRFRINAAKNQFKNQNHEQSR